MYEKVLVVTRRTRLMELLERFNTLGQARFYVEHAGGNFDDYADEDRGYQQAREALSRQLAALPAAVKTQWIDRTLLPTITINAQDLVLTLGQDGLVANTAKYAGSQPILAINPDPARYDGILLPFDTRAACQHLARAVRGQLAHRAVTLAEATLRDGQRLIGFNDIFVGAQSHVSARYTLRHGGREEVHSSSGVLVATGAGSTGWLSSVMNMVRGVAEMLGVSVKEQPPLMWDDVRLVYVVREPFVSRKSGASLVMGFVEAGQALELESHMPSGGVIFSDGMEADRLDFCSGHRVTVQPAGHQAHLLIPG